MTIIIFYATLPPKVVQNVTRIQQSSYDDRLQIDGPVQTDVELAERDEIVKVEIVGL